MKEDPVGRPIRLNWDNSCIRELPIDPEKDNYVRRNVPGACFSLVEPTPVEDPTLIAVSQEALDLVGLTKDLIEDNPTFVDAMAGCSVLPGSRPAAHTYCGHQFGHFSGQLGDGRAMYLGEVVNEAGERWEVQLKGAGKTPYSRDADGRAVLRSSIREFLCSEAMAALGVPTSRAGSLITSETRVRRDPMYDGNVIMEPATIVSRIAPSFLRFGSFEIFKPEDSVTGRAGPSTMMYQSMLPTMLSFTIRNYFPDIWQEHATGEDGDVPEAQLQPMYLAFYEEVVRRTARLVADWQCFGFCHGVLNTDNMSIVGITIDYGPFGWMDWFNWDYVCNASDHEGRYSYRNQPEMVCFNLEKLAEALNPIVPEETTKQLLKDTFEPTFDAHFTARMRAKLGLTSVPETAEGEDDPDFALAQSLFDTMHATAADMTNTFRTLSLLFAGESEGDVASRQAMVIDKLLDICAPVPVLQALAKPSMSREKLLSLINVAQSNPMMLYRLGIRPEQLMSEIKKSKTYQELQALDAEQRRQDNKDAWSQWMASYVARLSQEPDATDEQRSKLMGDNNPKYVLRNWLAQSAIEAAEKGDAQETLDLFTLLKDPFAKEDVFAERNYDRLPPEWSSELCVSCSS